MSSQLEHYRAQAQIMMDQADSAVLDNVRDRCLRSAEAWTSMADRAERGEQGRARAEAIKVAATAQQAASVGG